MAYKKRNENGGTYEKKGHYNKWGVYDNHDNSQTDTVGKLVPIKDANKKSTAKPKTYKTTASTTVRLVDKTPKSKLKNIKRTPAKKKALVREY